MKTPSQQIPDRSAPATGNRCSPSAGHPDSEPVDAEISQHIRESTPERMARMIRQMGVDPSRLHRWRRIPRLDGDVAGASPGRPSEQREGPCSVLLRHDPAAVMTMDRRTLPVRRTPAQGDAAGHKQPRPILKIDEADLWQKRKI